METKEYVSDTEAFKAISQAMEAANFKEALMIGSSGKHVNYTVLEKNPEDEDAAEVILYCQLSLDEFKDALTRCN